jgi:hypothetical protein
VGPNPAPSLLPQRPAKSIFNLRWTRKSKYNPENICETLEPFERAQRKSQEWVLPAATPGSDACVGQSVTMATSKDAITGGLAGGFVAGEIVRIIGLKAVPQYNGEQVIATRRSQRHVRRGRPC